MKFSLTRSGLVLGLLAALLTAPVSLTLTPPAAAAPAAEIEPNDTIFQTNVAANVEGIAGTLNVSDDVDYFWLGLRPQRQIRIVVTRGTCSGDTTLSIAGLDISFRWWGTEPVVRTLTTPGVYGDATQHFRVRFASAGATNCSYRLQVTSSTGGSTDAVDPTLPTELPVVQLPEPDDLPAQATGPLLGDTNYEGTVDTSNDVDNVFFQLKAGAAANVTLSVANGSVSVDTASYSLSDLDAYAGGTDTSSTDTSSSDRTFRLAITGSVGSRYRLSVSPASSLGTTTPLPPPPPSSGGGSATKRVRKVVLKAKPAVVRKWGHVTLQGKLKPGRRGRVVIWQRTKGAARGWHVEARVRASSNGRFRHSESIHAGSRMYRACFKSKCSKVVFVRML